MSGYNCSLLSEDRSFFAFTNSVDLDEMQHYSVFHLGLHCLQKYSFRGGVTLYETDSQSIQTGTLRPTDLDSTLFFTKI